MAGLERGLLVQRIYQDLVADAQFTGSYFAVRRCARRLVRFLPEMGMTALVE